MNREEYLIYCLLYAIDAANVKKQNLVQMALMTDSVSFVKIYNLIQQHDEATRKNIIALYRNDFNESEIIDEIKNTFLSELEISIQENIIEVLSPERARQTPC
ncbi:MAG: hypothetical protein J6U85_07210 [Bacteroidales bacterium]|nr:hypothetical protein [Bacteroidales bacterium]